ncbi:MAG: hypothetical protein J5594_03760 [Elusimicrobiaceae bacterium]|nr:hypothetical protein [Elusimicrobiaceae bacterium]
MKKLSISFILLFGLFTFVPQIALGDVVTSYSLEETHKLSNEVIESFMCFYKKKLNTPTNYKGQNLKLIEVPYYTYPRDFEYKPTNIPSYKYLTDAYLNVQDICNLFPDKTEEMEEEYFPTSVCDNGVCKEQKPSKTCRYTKYKNYNDDNKKTAEYNLDSFVSGCKEYVTVYKHSHYMIRDAYGYDVTNVPPGSYLKFIPETKELQVISNNDDSYKKDIPSKISALKAEGSKFRKTIRKDNIKAFFRKNINKIRYGAETKEEGEILSRIKSLECLGKKKSKLSQKYLGKDIRLKSCNKYKTNDDTEDFYYKLCSGETYFPVVSGLTENQYFIYGDNLAEEYFGQENAEKILLGKSSSPKGYHNNCHEYIPFSFFDTKSKSKIEYFADITNVPPNSYLEYIPGNETLRVIAPADDNYADIAKKYEEKQEKKNKQGWGKSGWGRSISGKSWAVSYKKDADGKNKEEHNPYDF